MKTVKKSILLFLVFCGVVLTVTQAFGAATGFEDDAGGPQGLAIQGDAPGEKLAGVVFLELFNQETVPCSDYPGCSIDIADGYAVVRLRKAQKIDTFYTEISDVPVDSPVSVQMAIMEALDSQIKEIFFDNDQTVMLVLRTAEEFGSVDIDRNGAISYIIADIVIAGK